MAVLHHLLSVSTTEGVNLKRLKHISHHQQATA